MDSEGVRYGGVALGVGQALARARLKAKLWVTMILTEVLQHPVTLQLRVPDLILQQNQLLLILVLEGLQPPLAVLQLVD